MRGCYDFAASNLCRACAMARDDPPVARHVHAVIYALSIDLRSNAEAVLRRLIENVVPVSL